MKILAKDSILTFGTKSIAFEIKRKEDIAYIDYYDNKVKELLYYIVIIKIVRRNTLQSSNGKTNAIK